MGSTHCNQSSIFVHLRLLRPAFFLLPPSFQYELPKGGFSGRESLSQGPAFYRCYGLLVFAKIGVRTYAGATDLQLCAAITGWPLCPKERVRAKTKHQLESSVPPPKEGFLWKKSLRPQAAVSLTCRAFFVFFLKGSHFEKGQSVNFHVPNDKKSKKVCSIFSHQFFG